MFQKKEVQFFHVSKDQDARTSRTLPPSPPSNVGPVQVYNFNTATINHSTLHIMHEGLTVQELAEKVAGKYLINPGKLKTINLLVEEDFQFAEELQNEMRIRGFKSLTVHAMRPPATTLPATKVHIEYTTRESDGALLVSAYCYRNDKATSNESDKLYICSNTPYQEGFKLPQCQVQQQATGMSENVAVAITFLRSIMDRVETDKGQKAVQATIESLQRHPNFDNAHILAKCKEKGCSMALINALSGELVRHISEIAQHNRQVELAAQSRPQENEHYIVHQAKSFLSFIQQYFQRFYINHIDNEAATEQFQGLLDNVTQSLTAYRGAAKQDKQGIATELYQNLNNLKQHLIKEIENYLLDNPDDNEQKSVRSQKRAVMKMFKSYLENPTNRTLNNINRVINHQNKALNKWDQSWTFNSRVKEAQLELKKIQTMEQQLNEQVDNKHRPS